MHIFVMNIMEVSKTHPPKLKECAKLLWLISHTHKVIMPFEYTGVQVE